MARYDVYVGFGEAPFLLDVQTDLIGTLATRVVVPLLPAQARPLPVGRLHPVFEIDGQRLVMATQLISAVDASMLKEKAANLTHRHDDVVAALDMLFHGF